MFSNNLNKKVLICKSDGINDFMAFPSLLQQDYKVAENICITYKE